MASKCTLEIVKAAEGKMTEAEAETLRKNIEDLASHRVRNRKSKPATAVKDATDELVKQEKILQAIKDANRLRHALRKKELYSFVDQFGSEEFIRGVNSIFEDLKGTQDGMGRNVDELQKTYAQTFKNKLRMRLEKDNLLQLAMGGKLDKQIWEETYNLTSKKPEPPGTVSKSKPAADIAKHIHDVRSEIRARLNAEGANIGELTGYTHPQKWGVDILTTGGREYGSKKIRADAEKIAEAKNKKLLADAEKTGKKDVKLHQAGEFLMKAARDRFIKFFTPLVDTDKTLRPGTELKVFLKEYFDNYVGHHFGTQKDKASYYGLEPYKSALVTRLGSERKLHLKNAEASYLAAQEYGQTKIMDGVMTQFDSLSRSLALLERLGPDPDRQFAELIEHYRDKFQEEGKLKLVSDLAPGKAGYAKLKRIFDYATGSGLIPENNTWANIEGNTKSLIRQATLGGSGITAITDPVFMNNTLANRGMGFLDAAGRQVRAYLDQLTSPGQKAAAKAAAVGMDTFNGSIARRVDATSSKANNIFQTMEKWFFKMTLLPWITDTSKEAGWSVMSTFLGELSGVKYSKLDPDILMNLKRFDISEVEWDFLRKNAGRIGGDSELNLAAVDWVKDHKIIMADELPDVDASVLKQLGLKDTPANRKRALNRLKDKLNLLYIDFVETAVPTPGAREQRQLRFGVRPGTGLGTAVGLATMLKSFAQTVLNKNVGETFRLRGGSFKEGGVKNFIREGSGPVALIRLAALTTIFGYFSMTIKDWLNGKSRRPLLDEEGNVRYATFFQAFQRGGATGFYGDFLLSEYDRSYRSFSQSLLGPALGRLDPLADVATRIATGDKVATQGSRLVLDNMPFINLFYIKPVLNQMFFYELNEAIDPGWTDRMKKSVKENSGQTFGGGPFPMLGPN